MAGPADGGIEVEVSRSIEGFRWNEGEYLRLLAEPVMADLVRRAILVQTTARSIMGKVAPPAPPGHPPATRTGLLVGSITWRPGVDELSPYVDIGSAVEYSIYLERGTRRMAARPFLRPALEAARASF